MSLRNNNSSNRMDVQENEFKTCDDIQPVTLLKYVDKKKKRRRRNKKMRHLTSQSSLHTLPREILQKVFEYCDRSSLEALKLTLPRFSTVIEEEGLLWETSPKLNLDQLPSELLLAIFTFISRQDLGRIASVCTRFRDLTYAECLWISDARECLATNGLDPNMNARTLSLLTSRDRIRISKNWSEGNYHETTLLVQSIRYMPRIQLERSALWVGWGNKIWSHPRNGDGTISRTTNRVLKGHTDDVARFVVKNGLVVSGGRDQSLFGWSSDTGDFLFAKRYCHGSEVSAVDVSGQGSIVVSGSRDRTVKIWSLLSNHEDCSMMVQSNNYINTKNVNNNSSTWPHLVGTVDIGDRIWSLAADPYDRYVAIGSAGLCGVPSLHLLDLHTGIPSLELGHTLKRGAGMLDLSWETESTFLSCGYDSCTRLWDTRVGNCVRSWEEPFNEAIYCLATDNNMTLVCGTARHGLVRLWDMRQKEHVQMIYTKHAYAGQSSPVYSVGFDMSHLYVALDQCLSLVSFDGQAQAQPLQNNNNTNNNQTTISNSRGNKHYR